MVTIKGKARAMKDINITKEGERCAKILIKELRGELLLALRHTRGENSNVIRTEIYIRDSLDKLEKLEDLVT